MEPVWPTDEIIRKNFDLSSSTSIIGNFDKTASPEHPMGRRKLVQPELMLS